MAGRQRVPSHHAGQEVPRAVETLIARNLRRFAEIGPGRWWVAFTGGWLPACPIGPARHAQRLTGQGWPSAIGVPTRLVAPLRCEGRGITMQATTVQGQAAAGRSTHHPAVRAPAIHPTHLARPGGRFRPDSRPVSDRLVPATAGCAVGGLRGKRAKLVRQPVCELTGAGRRR